MIEIQWKDPEMLEMQEFYNMGLPGNLYLSHYELAEQSEHTASDWKRFLTEPQVADYVMQELRLLKMNEMRKLLRDVSGKSRSVGTAQLVTALTKAIDGEQTKDGPIFIYSYVPLNERELDAPNVQLLQHDPFKKG